MSDPQEELANKLESLPKVDLRMSEAMIISFLVNKEWVKTKKIEKSVGLSQPVVCISLNRLEDKGWVESKRADGVDCPGGVPKKWKLKNKWLADLSHKIKSYLKDQEYNIKRLKIIKSSIEK